MTKHLGFPVKKAKYLVMVEWAEICLYSFDPPFSDPVPHTHDLDIVGVDTFNYYLRLEEGLARGNI